LNFDDPGSGVDNTSTMEKPEHIFASSGNYNVFMQIIDECGIIVDTTITTRIFDSNDLQPDFDHPNPICAFNEINFSDLSTFEVDSVKLWLWDFGDPQSGENNLSNEQNPIHSFDTADIYNISLLITGMSGCSKQVMNPRGPLIVEASPEPNFEVDGSCKGDIFNFKDLSFGNDITNYLWDFGDGFSSNLQAPSHLYMDGGSYEVTLTVSNATGCQNELVKFIEVGNIPTANFTNELACSEQDIQFFD